MAIVISYSLKVIIFLTNYTLNTEYQVYMSSNTNLVLVLFSKLSRY